MCSWPFCWGWEEQGQGWWVAAAQAGLPWQLYPVPSDWLPNHDCIPWPPVGRDAARHMGSQVKRCLAASPRAKGCLHERASQAVVLKILTCTLESPSPGPCLMITAAPPIACACWRLSHDLDCWNLKKAVPGESKIQDFPVFNISGTTTCWASSKLTYCSVFECQTFDH